MTIERRIVSLFVALPLLAVLASCSVAGAKSVVEEYCRLDSLGARIGGNPSLNAQYGQLVGWEAEPGWDVVTIISSWDVSDPKGFGSHASVVVRYNVIGQSFDPSANGNGNRQESVTYQLSRRGDKWIINKGLVHPHVTAETYLLHLQRLEPIRKRLSVVVWGRLDSLGGEDGRPNNGDRNEILLVGCGVDTSHATAAAA